MQKTNEIDEKAASVAQSGSLGTTTGTVTVTRTKMLANTATLAATEEALENANQNRKRRLETSDEIKMPVNSDSARPAEDAHSYSNDELLILEERNNDLQRIKELFDDIKENTDGTRRYSKVKADEMRDMASTPFLAEVTDFRELTELQKTLLTTVANSSLRKIEKYEYINKIAHDADMRVELSALQDKIGELIQELSEEKDRLKEYTANFVGLLPRLLSECESLSNKFK